MIDKKELHWLIFIIEYNEEKKRVHEIQNQIEHRYHSSSYSNSFCRLIPFAFSFCSINCSSVGLIVLSTVKSSELLAGRIVDSGGTSFV